MKESEKLMKIERMRKFEGRREKLGKIERFERENLKKVSER